jgi:phosphoribosylpyrophosphate synthetase
MIALRTRKYKIYILNRYYRDDLLKWKASCKDGSKPLPDEILKSASHSINSYFQGFDLITVPAPSRHDYNLYPAWEIVKQIKPFIDIPEIILFPEKSGKKRYDWRSTINKEIQDVTVEPNKFILILDDLCSTGHTMRVTAEAICRKGSFPCCLALGGDL